MHALGLKGSILTRYGNLRDVAGRVLEVEGYYQCMISINNRHTYQPIYFIKSATKCFLSLDACKELKLVHQSFPEQIATVGQMLQSRPTAGRTSTALRPEETADKVRQNIVQHSPTDPVRVSRMPPTQALRKTWEIPMPPREENIERLQQ